MGAPADAAPASDETSGGYQHAGPSGSDQNAH
jgi:hypothetical protein